MYPDIPDEQLTKLRPVLDALLSAFQAIEKRIPITTDSALIYTPVSEPESGNHT